MRRVVSEPSSTSASSRSVTKPATSTRRKRLTSIFDWSGVSTGTSTTVAQPEASRAAAARPRLRRLLLAISLVIGFSEEIVVLLDVQAAGGELQGLLESLAGFGELPLLLERDAQVVQGLGTAGVEGDRALEAEARFVPQALACDLDTERDLVVARRGRHAAGSQEQGEERDDHQHGALRKW